MGTEELGRGAGSLAVERVLPPPSLGLLEPWPPPPPSGSTSNAPPTPSPNSLCFLPHPAPPKPLPQGDGGASATGHVASFPFVSESSRAQALRKRACAYFCLYCVCCVCKHTCACMCAHTCGPCPAAYVPLVHTCDQGHADPRRPVFGMWHGVSAHMPGHLPMQAWLRAWHETVCRGVTVHITPAGSRKGGAWPHPLSSPQGHPVYPHGATLGPSQPTWSRG